MFRDLIPMLADDFHLLAPDYQGFGYSACPASEFEYTFDHLAQVMEQFVSALGLQRYALYMQDLGGPVGPSQEDLLQPARIPRNQNRRIDDDP
jgi:pimeloyl-ACP methyl ester carboxylesterase